MAEGRAERAAERAGNFFKGQVTKISQQQRAPLGSGQFVQGRDQLLVCLPAGKCIEWKLRRRWRLHRAPRRFVDVDFHSQPPAAIDDQSVGDSEQERSLMSLVAVAVAGLPG